MINRAIIIVLDSFGVGEAPDAKEYGDEGSNTLEGIYYNTTLNLPNMKKLGLYNIDGLSITEKENMPVGIYGKAAEKTKGKNSPVGHWEIAGFIKDEPFKTYYNGLSLELQSRIADLGIKCYKSLGFSASMGHLEVILKENGEISPLEIGARSSGFIASDLIDICSGDDFVGSFINVLKGGRVPNGLHKQTDRTALYYFYDLPFGTRIKKLCTIMEFLPDSVTSKFSNRDGLVLGKIIPLLDNDNDRLGFEILDGPKEILTIETVKKAEEAMIKEMVEEI